MDRYLTFNQMIKQTYFKILRQFLINLFLFYLLPMSLTAFTNITEKNAGAFTIYFSTASWIYISLILLFIITKNMRDLLEKIKQETIIVYNQSILGDTNENDSAKLTLIELIETRQKIQEMQSTIKKIIQSEKQQKQELMFQVSAAAHDLKTPLTVIQGNAQFLQSMYIPGNIGQCLEDIDLASQQLNLYFNQLINYSKTFYNDTSNWESLSSDYLFELFEQEIKLITDKKADIQFSNNLPASIYLTLNLNLFLRAILNIVNNAIDHSQSSYPTIKINYKLIDNQFYISIWNSDSSFTENLLEKYGLLFYQDKQATDSEKRSNFGIGLAFVKRVAKIHGGQVNLSNFDNGALVTICIPI
ncbi:sensor histidine kinase KdpD [Streptococcus sp. HMSC076C08]|uniref:sensor histidine kinase n=1 Tax=Streptococcus sp. HMSC076C08 TaxID=1739270 RepID=UPI0008A18329|nr:HAMP domain-containing sensor histidine kinase [Streptococcus sp. HMSC076C08]OFL47637.1 two-component sensor histidine kinase [Streptococcus sp. HMSC076C08]